MHCSSRPVTTLLSRRRFLALSLVAVPSLSLANAVALEPDHLKVTRLCLGGPEVRHRFVHISDLHHRNDPVYTDKIIQAVRRVEPEFVCFTGDLIDSDNSIAGALEFVRALGCPVYGIPGNHDHRCQRSFHANERAFAATGGSWLTDRSVTKAGKFEIIGLDQNTPRNLPKKAEHFRIVLSHYPAQADTLSGYPSSLILAGHSHGGQVRLPFLGPILLPSGVGRYDRGLFKTPAGPLHVSVGLGTSTIPIRFNCRPEITVIEL